MSKQFQESVRGAKDGCPLMCKRKFKDNGMTGFPLDQLNEALGTTNVRTYFCIIILGKVRACFVVVY